MMLSLCTLIPLWAIPPTPVLAHTTQCTDTPSPTTITGEVRINEFVSNPGAQQHEWVELYLVNGSTQDMTGWTLEDAKGKIATITGTLTKQVPYLVIELSSAKLNNNGDQLILKTPDETPISTARYGSANPDLNAPHESESIAFDNTTQTYVISSTITPGTANTITPRASQETQSPSSGSQTTSQSAGQTESGLLPGDHPTPPTPLELQIQITEVLPNPEGDDDTEFVELFNPTSSTVSLVGWELHDGSKKGYQFADEILEPRSYLIVERDVSGLSLNNVGEEIVALWHKDGSVIASTTYSSAAENHAWMLHNNGKWYWSLLPTPGAPNQLEQPILTQKNNPIVDVPFVTLKDVAELELGTQLQTKGLVSALPGTFGSQIFYISGSGIQVYLFSKDFPPLAIGDEVLVSGELTESRGERRIKVSGAEDIQVVGFRELIPESKSLDQISDAHIATLIQTNGVITERTKSQLYIDNTKAELRIDPKNIGELLDGLHIDDEIQVTGIIRPNNKGITLYPRDAADVIITSSSPTSTPIAATVPDSDFPMFRTILVVGGVGILYVTYRFFNTKTGALETEQIPIDLPLLHSPLHAPVRITQEEEIQELIMLHKEMQ